MPSKKLEENEESNEKKIVPIAKKLTKKQSSNKRHMKYKDYYMPQEKLTEILEEIEHEVEWGHQYSERRCSALIHQISPHIRHNYQNTSFKLLEEARVCLLERDWYNLAKILVMAKPTTRREHMFTFQIFVRYAVICLKHTRNEELLDMLAKGVADCLDDSEKKKFLKSLFND